MTEKTAEKAFVKNQLTNAEVYRLTRWLDENKDILIPARMTRAQIAVRASQALDYPITGANVHGAAKNLGIQIGQFHERRQETVAGDAYGVLVRGVLELYKRLGEKAPRELAEIGIAKS